MITGAVNDDREAVVEIGLLGPRRRRKVVEVVIDTGFDGWLSLPPSTINFLRLPWRRRGRAILADGSETLFDIYEGMVEWDGREMRIPIDEAETAPLAGMSLLSGFELNVEVRPRGKVRIRRLK
jgi:clan AA aspartic protease